jgi:hypothetical protein
MMGRKQKLDADGWDVTTRWRRMVKSFDRAGVTKSIKKRMNKAYRRDGKKQIAQELSYDG